MIVAGTGHRPNKLGGYSQEAFEHLVTIAQNWLLENKPSKVISGMALGWDQALVQGAINLNIPFIAVLPFEGQEALWPTVRQEYYKELLLQSERVFIFSKDNHVSNFQGRNMYMVDKSDIILAMYDGTKGGTHNCIEYAKSKNKQIINLFDKL